MSKGGELLDNILHFGVKGMRWGKRRGPTSESLAKRKAKYIKKQERMGIKNTKLEKRIVNADSKAGFYKKEAGKYQTKFNKQVVDTMASGGSKRATKKAKRYAKRLKKYNEYDVLFTRKSAKYKRMIYKNKKLHSKLDVKIKDIDKQSLALGKAAVKLSMN